MGLVVHHLSIVLLDTLYRNDILKKIIFSPEFLTSIDMYVILLGFILGMVTILAKPTVNVLTHQIEDVTSGSVKRKDVMIALALGEALAVTLSIVRILIPEIQLWCYLLPGYIIAIVMAYFVPELFVGIAFDSGQVVSGPMTVTFILAFTQGAAEAIESANVLVDGFGVVATIAMISGDYFGHCGNVV